VLSDLAGGRLASAAAAGRPFRDFFSQQSPIDWGSLDSLSPDGYLSALSIIEVSAFSPKTLEELLS